MNDERVVDTSSTRHYRVGDRAYLGGVVYRVMRIIDATQMAIAPEATISDESPLTQDDVRRLTAFKARLAVSDHV